MNISAKDVMSLRKKTGISMMSYKNALIEANGDLDKSILILCKIGKIKAQGREYKETKEGIILTHLSENRKFAFLLKVNCETDFVARTDEFIDFCKNIFSQIVIGKIKNDDEINCKELSAKLGEKISVNFFRVEIVDDPNKFIQTYVHTGN